MTAKQTTYNDLISRCKALVAVETDWIANAANVCSEVHRTMGFLWTGIYRVIDNELVLGPFQGPVACTRIPYGKGVCGTAWEQKSGILVPDVEKFPGHIRCSSAARSEIVIPIWQSDKIIGVLDIDSGKINGLNKNDLRFLTEIANLIPTNIPL